MGIVNKTFKIAQVTPGVAVVSGYFTRNENDVENITVVWNYWHKRHGTNAYNPEMTGGTITVDPKQHSGKYFSARIDIPATASWVRAWAKETPKMEDSNGKQKPKFGDNNWSIAVDLDMAVNAWPKPPTEPPNVEIDGYKMEISYNNLKPISPDGLNFATDILFQVTDKNGKPLANHFSHVWTNTGNPGKDDVDYKSSAYWTFDMQPGQEYWVRATSARSKKYGYNASNRLNDYYYPQGWGSPPTGNAAGDGGAQGEPMWSPWAPGEGQHGYQAPPGKIQITDIRAMSSTSVKISWTQVLGADTYQIEYATQKEYLGQSNASQTVDDIQIIDSAANKGTFYIITGIDAGSEYYFRVRSKNESGEGTWSDIKKLTLGREPAAPTTWSSTTTAVVGREVYLYWVHNSEDNSLQQKAELELVDNSGNTTVVPFDTPDLNPDGTMNDPDKKTTSYKLVIDSGYSEGAKIKWRVRTAGITGKFGPWSVQRLVSVFAKPRFELIEFNQPDFISNFPFTIRLTSWPRTQKPLSYTVSMAPISGYTDFDPTGEKVYITRSTPVYSETIDTNSYEVTFEVNPGNANLSNNVTYNVAMTVAMDSGLTATEERQIVVQWDESMDGELDAVVRIDPNNVSANIYPTYTGVDGSPIENTSISVYRKDYDGALIPISVRQSNTQSYMIVDPHPPLDYARYRIVAISDTTGAVKFVDLPAYPVGEIYSIIQWDEQWSDYYPLYDGPGQIVQQPWSGSLLKLPWNLDVSDSWNLQKENVEYIGRHHPVGYYGTQEGTTSSWKIDVVKEDREMIAQLRRLARYKGDVYVREPYGSGYWANVDISFSQNHTKVTVPVNIKITRVEGKGIDGEALGSMGNVSARPGI